MTSLLVLGAFAITAVAYVTIGTMRKTRAQRRKGVAMPGLWTLMRGAAREAREARRSTAAQHPGKRGKGGRNRSRSFSGTDIHYADFGGDSGVSGAD